MAAYRSRRQLAPIQWFPEFFFSVQIQIFNPSTPFHQHWPRKRQRRGVESPHLAVVLLNASLGADAVAPSRMLKKSTSGGLTLLRGSTLSGNSSELGNTVGAFPFARIHYTCERPHEVRYVPPRLFARCGLAGQPFEHPVSEAL